MVSGAWGAVEAILFVVFMLAAVVGGTYWWMWVGGQRDRLPSWGVWVYVACLVIGNAAGLALIALYYGT